MLRPFALLVLPLGTACSLFVDTQGFTGDCSNASSSTLLCDDFEHGLDPATWTISTTGAGAAAVDTVQAHSGSHAFHSSSPAVTSSVDDLHAQLVHEIPPPMPAPAYVRMWVYFATPGAEGAEIVAAFQDHSPYNGLQVQVVSGQYAINDWTPPGAFANEGAVTTDAWTCLEWEVDTSASALWLGATESGSLPVPVPDDLGAVRFGLTFMPANAQPAYDLWVDDVVVATERVDCPD